MSSAHPLAALLTGHFDAIMERERTNRSSVHLYGAGDYWVAFEQSAYQLCQLMPSCETTLSGLRSIPSRWSWRPLPMPSCNLSCGCTSCVPTSLPTRCSLSGPIRRTATGRGTGHWSVILPLPRSGRPEPKDSSDKQTVKTR